MSTFVFAEITRSRNAEDWNNSDIVVDVGAVFDPSRNLFDHHQREFKETFSAAHATKLSSAGLVYKYFGRQVLTALYSRLHASYTDAPKLNDHLFDVLYTKIYDDLIEEFDAVDNGVSPYPSELQPAFKFGSTSIFARVGNLNPEWNANEADTTSGEIMKRFLTAVSLTGESFLDRFIYLWTSWIPARNVVLEAVQNRFNIDASGNVIALACPCPWKDHLFDIEKELDCTGELLYCIYPDNVHHKTMIQAVPITSTSFQSRMALPESWRGLRDKHLDAESGIHGCVFTHASGFIGGHNTIEGAIQMTRLALKINHLTT